MTTPFAVLGSVPKFEALRPSRPYADVQAAAVRDGHFIPCIARLQGGDLTICTHGILRHLSLKSLLTPS